MDRWYEQLDETVRAKLQETADRAELYINVADFIGQRRRWFLILLLRYLGPADAEDALHDFLLKKLPGVVLHYRPANGNFSGYLVRSVSNFGISYREKLNHRPARLDDKMDPPDDRPSAEEVLAREEILCAAVEALDEKERAVIELVREGRTPAEIAAELGISVDCVNVRIFRAKKKLRAHIERSSRPRRDQRNQS